MTATRPSTLKRFSALMADMMAELEVDESKEMIRSAANAVLIYWGASGGDSPESSRVLLLARGRRVGDYCPRRRRPGREAVKPYCRVAVWPCGRVAVDETRRARASVTASATELTQGHLSLSDAPLQRHRGQGAQWRPRQMLRRLSFGAIWSMSARGAPRSLFAWPQWAPCISTACARPRCTGDDFALPS